MARKNNIFYRISDNWMKNGISIITFGFSLLGLFAGVLDVFPTLKSLFDAIIGFFVGDANAQSTSNETLIFDTINLSTLITVCLISLYVYAFFHSINNNDAEKRRDAKSHTTLIGGVLLGSLRSSLGI